MWLGEYYCREKQDVTNTKSNKENSSEKALPTIKYQQTFRPHLYSILAESQVNWCSI